MPSPFIQLVRAGLPVQHTRGLDVRDAQGNARDGARQHHSVNVRRADGFEGHLADAKHVVGVHGKYFVDLPS
eukprot:8694447-Pyramimonas_sp.AAC.1